MRIISRKILREFCQRQANSRTALEQWYKIASKAQWRNLIEVQQTYSTAEAVGNFTVFNIKGNNYRLIADVIYARQTIYIKYILTHADYDKGDWKNDPYF
ncbi:MAG: type II toxin-antitoxin system HigB family toxin [Cyanobacteria bacterium]|nr:type II toxin-antitoxin system HigB family toxin [Cyanobacteria bacterium CG_2015-16_32_12]NCO77941.1 type II toxin-antitoxin system HigB family toxin [Cyanobacteria bacterium CG_2015-22_32_23]NCQ05664.1 type II toxin-antitoxin system HigB family toxin [Cyanobacteria bacterium CG_2015-09_32_10]NCQ41518.1 type II toxin-antitoxin system HigB family toxin [Cyanobacteria bacterium CG_2015-04_32_10]NCS85533.1 type II toxin-antitoxin system HigB family toxin [Cyanobacteria bacterium CG_2015-02_32_